jgi:hypothetical protein
MPEDAVQILSNGGSIGIILLMLVWFRSYVQEHTRTLREIMTEYNDRIDRTTNDFMTKLDRMSTDTTSAIGALTTEVKSLAHRIDEEK